MTSAASRRRHCGPRTGRGGLGRSRESGETRGDGPDVHAAQPVRSRDGLDGCPDRRAAVQELLGHLDALRRVIPSPGRRRPIRAARRRPGPARPARRRPTAAGPDRLPRPGTCLNSAGKPREWRPARRGPRPAPGPDDAERGDTVAPSGLRIVSMSPSSGKPRRRLAPRARGQGRRAACSPPPAATAPGMAEATRRSQRRTDSARSCGAVSASGTAAPRDRRVRVTEAPVRETRREEQRRRREDEHRGRARDRRSVSRDGRTRPASANAKRDGREGETRNVKRRPGGGEGGRESAQPQRGRGARASPRLARLRRRDAHASAAAASASRPVCARKSGRPGGTRLIVSKSPGATRAAVRPRRPGPRARGIARTTLAACGPPARPRALRERPHENERREAGEEHVCRRPEKPEERRRIPSDGEHARGAKRRSEQEGEPGGHDAGRGAPGREPERHRENREKESRPQGARAPHLLLRDLGVGRFHGEREQPVAPLGGRHAQPQARRAVLEREELERDPAAGFPSDSAG